MASMATKRLTFTLPQDLVAEFLPQVPSGSRSKFVAIAIRAQIREREAQLVRACEVANTSIDVLDIETSFDGLADKADSLTEPL